KAIQAMLGHASIILTADTYTSVLPGLARATAEAVAAQILKAARTPPASPRPHPGLTRRRHDHRRGCITAGPGPPVGPQGGEPCTNGLKVRCSAIELPPRSAAPPQQRRKAATPRTEAYRNSAVRGDSGQGMAKRQRVDLLRALVGDNRLKVCGMPDHRVFERD